MEKVNPCKFDASQIMSVSEVGVLLNVSKNKVYSMLEEGSLKGFKIGKLWRVCPSDIDNYKRPLPHVRVGLGLPVL